MQYLIYRVILTFVVTASVYMAKAQTAFKSSPKEGLLWEISGKGLKEPSYLFGTYHFAGKDFLNTLPGVTQCLRKAKSVVGEVLIENELAMAQKLMPFMLLKDNSLDKILAPKEYAETDSFLTSKSPMSLSMLNGLKPAAIQVMLLSFMAPKTITAENPALDKYFQMQAVADNKPVLGLETLEEQVVLLMGSSVERQKELLLKTIRESDKVISESARLFELYKSQDLEAMEKEFLDNDDYTAEEMDELLGKRNRKWIAKMPGLMNNGPVFFAVGAGHLMGPDGLISLLKKSGYQVEAVAAR